MILSGYGVESGTVLGDNKKYEGQSVEREFPIKILLSKDTNKGENHEGTIPI